MPRSVDADRGRCRPGAYGDVLRVAEDGPAQRRGRVGRPRGGGRPGSRDEPPSGGSGGVQPQDDRRDRERTPGAAARSVGLASPGNGSDPAYQLEVRDRSSSAWAERRPRETAGGCTTVTTLGSRSGGAHSLDTAGDIASCRRRFVRFTLDWQVEFV